MLHWRKCAHQAVLRRPSGAHGCISLQAYMGVRVGAALLQAHHQFDVLGLGPATVLVLLHAQHATACSVTAKEEDALTSASNCMALKSLCSYVLACQALRHRGGQVRLKTDLL